MPLLSYHMTSEAPEFTYTLIRRVLTALIHHVKNADQFTPLADLLVAQFTSLKPADITLPEDIEGLRRMLEIISVPTAVRQGSRLTRTFYLLREQKFLSDNSFFIIMQNSSSVHYFQKQPTSPSSQLCTPLSSNSQHLSLPLPKCPSGSVQGSNSSNAPGSPIYQRQLPACNLH